MPVAWSFHIHLIHIPPPFVIQLNLFLESDVNLCDKNEDADFF